MAVNSAAATQAALAVSSVVVMLVKTAAGSAAGILMTLMDARMEELLIRTLPVQTGSAPKRFRHAARTTIGIPKKNLQNRKWIPAVNAPENDADRKILLQRMAFRDLPVRVRNSVRAELMTNMMICGAIRR